GLALLGRLVDPPLHVALDGRDHLIGDAELLEPLAVGLDRVALLPLLELALGAILRRVGARMPAVAVGDAFDQRRPAAGARLPIGRPRRGVERVARGGAPAG